MTIYSRTVLPGWIATLELAASAVRSPPWAINLRVRYEGLSTVYGAALDLALPTLVDASNPVGRRG